MPSIRSTVIAACAIALLSACSGKSEPNEKNFSTAIEEHLAVDGPRCLPVMNWPDQVPTHKPESADWLAAYRALEEAGLLSEKPLARVEINHDAESVFSLTDKGRAALDHASTIGNNTMGRLCYGKAKLAKVVGWEGPVTAGDYSSASVTYRYSLADVPAWANDPRVKGFWTKLSDDINGRGIERWGVELRGGAWHPLKG